MKVWSRVILGISASRRFRCSGGRSRRHRPRLGLYDACDFVGTARRRSRRCGSTCATSRRTTCAGFDAVAHLAALSNDPLGDLNPGITYDINQHASVRLAPSGQGGRRRAVPVLVVVQPLRRRRRRLARRTRPVQSGDAVRRIEDSRRTGTGAPRRRRRSRRSTCATPPPTASRAACARTSS